MDHRPRQGFGASPMVHRSGVVSYYVALPWLIFSFIYGWVGAGAPTEAIKAPPVGLRLLKPTVGS